jgi:hypothetical protein
MARYKYKVTIYGKRKGGGSASYEVEVEADDSILRTGVQENNEAMRYIVMSQRPDVMTSHGIMEEIKVLGFQKIN